MINAENIGKRLRQVREFVKYTQFQMSQLLRIQLGTYKKNEKGIHLIGLHTLGQLHKELGISAEWLLFENGPIYGKDILDKSTVNKEGNRDSFEEEVEEMTQIMKKVPMIRYSVMLHYQDCKVRFKDLILV
jgi:transcriptional regulator with XRE-family HTH domain